ncbi:hypothetical protein [Natrialbaceae archaeon AArc-T1-2]|uniref:hypothetical protein n=1 Tax=Natrialbaceae archaeon AArc-T1-2 TaxID=3053904 RepID=UPI00255A8F67|nr:hypothetical protein [Natrialbaceae archaeon AArc-T1-2]WIV66570.1 hypothetical protein QQ977_12835 [Natrialbaceae archaeon AArc-T1-2]
MGNDIMDSVEGPRTIRIFRDLLMIAVLLFVLGVVLAELYGFPWLERFMQGFVDNPGILLDIAGIISFFILLFIGARFVLKHVE